MKVTIEVNDRNEADAVRLAMADPATRAMVLVVGTLLPFPKAYRRKALAEVQEIMSGRSKAWKSK